MNRYTRVLAASLLACTAQVTVAAGSPGVERHVQGFLDALAAGGGWVLGDFPTHERFVRDLRARPLCA
jgi:hypothetical protein